MATLALGRVAVLTLALAAPLSVPAAARADCTLAEADRAWIGELTDRWGAVSRDALRETPIPLPWTVFFNESCAWHLKPGAPLAAVPHNGQVRLPDGRDVPARLMTFVATYDDQQTPFMVMAMPSIWRAEPRHATDPALPQLMRAVFAHEMTHARQFAAISRRIDAVERQFGLPGDLDDDIVQNRFAAAPGFADAYRAERDLLYRASREGDSLRQRALATEAAAVMKARRARYFTGDDAVFADLEDVFLHMEGLGQFVAYRSALLDGMTAADAVEFVRRDGRFWSQDEGLAVYLLLDAMLPGWQTRVLDSSVPGVVELITEAAVNKR
jgi:hypothetical protein